MSAIEKAARAVWLAGFPPGDNADLSAHFDRQMEMEPRLRDVTIHQAMRYASTAIIAFLEDGELVEVVARASRPSLSFNRARASLAALRTLVTKDETK